jgi:ankyrin repeat protein
MGSEDLDAFIEAACVPLNAGHGDGTLEEAEAFLAAHPEIATSGIHTAAILGDYAVVRRLLTRDAGDATAKGGPRAWDALTYLCFSRYLRLDRSRSDGFTRSTEALLEAGANPNTGFFSEEPGLKPGFESAIYGAAGVAHHPGVTRLLLDYGADPNDDETPYHAAEGYDNAAMEVLVESGKLTQDSLVVLIVRKADWHDLEGIRFLLEHGADPNRKTRWEGKTALHQAILRDNRLPIIEEMLDHGADPALTNAAGRSAVAMAARRGRGDVLETLGRRGVPLQLHGVERLIAACARNDAGAVRSLTSREPDLVGQLRAQGGTLLAEFAGVGNTEAVRRLLDLGVDVGAKHLEGDIYSDVTKESTALHVAAWRAEHATVRLLLERRAQVNARDGKGRTPLALAVRACVHSYWTHRRSPESVEALLRAGASAEDVPFPSGYAEVDELLRASRGRSHLP